MSDADGPNITPLHGREPPRSGRPRVKRLRLLLIVVPLGVLAVISTVFGMMMAVASDLPALENREEFKNAKNSVLMDVRMRPLGILTSNENRVFVSSAQISPAMKNAIISIEDRRFYENQGVDLRGIARAFFSDVVKQRAAQGGSTITQQFVKLALQAQAKRTVFQKLREAALAYHLTRKWSKDKILTEYLNTIYFGNGAYGIESAARTYFGHEPDHVGCGTIKRPCAAELKPYEAALLAGIVQSPSGYDPLVHPVAAITRRNQVLRTMVQQGRLTQAEYVQDRGEALPGKIAPPAETAPTPAIPYFTTWVRQQLVDRYGAQQAFQGGLKIQTTLDLDLQRKLEQAIQSRIGLLQPQGVAAAAVVLDNATGEVRAMVGGRDYNRSPFNLATQGQRQPGSAFKPFTLAVALKRGISPNSTWPSQRFVFKVPHGGGERFTVNNYEDEYLGATSLANAIAQSDNSVFVHVGIKVGIRRIARMAERMGIRTRVSRNYAITLGGLREGVTPLDMAHAYETLAHNGQLVTGSLGASRNGPVGIRSVELPTGKVDKNQTILHDVLPHAVADTETRLLQGVVTSGTGKAAAYGGFAAGKTGTTENYGDAWFVGFSRKYTMAVWVGYPNKLKSMTTEYHGKSVAGGTFPAEIWHDFMVGAQQVELARVNRKRAAKGLPPETLTTTTPATTVPATPTTPAVTVPPSGGTTTTTPSTKSKQPPATATPPPATATPAPGTPAPAPTPTPTPTPGTPTTPAPPPAGGTGGTGGTGTGPAGGGGTG
jgi:penicillin-binding protein 1A